MTVTKTNLSLSSLSHIGSHYLALTELELTRETMLLLNFDTPPASASQILGLEACLINFSSLPSLFFKKPFCSTED